MPASEQLLIFVATAVLAIQLLQMLRDSSQAVLRPLVSRMHAVQSEVESMISREHYATESQRGIVLASVKDALGPTSSLRWILFATKAQRLTAANLHNFLQGSIQLVAMANRDFVESELRNFQRFFDSIESQPLTESQRRACIVCEDNNLVLAGAGTGKTSTMIGRAGYLIASRRVAPDKILMLAFARKAADEMQERQDARLAGWINGVAPKISTFHGLSLAIIGKAEGRRPAVSPMADDKRRFARFIDEQLSKLCQDPTYRSLLVRYFGSEQYHYRNPFDFASAKEYYDYVRSNELRTLRGEAVKSFEECVIANFLNAQGVRYEYEREYEIDTAGPDYRQYRPDFYLPDYGIYIEHFALNKAGSPPPHFDQARYMQGISWKRQLHTANDTTLIETFSYMKRDGVLEHHLSQSLLEAGVEFSPRTSQEMLEELRQTTVVSDFSELLATFLRLFKESGHSLTSLKERVKSDIDSSRLILLLQLLSPVLDAYEKELAGNGQIDFTDMIRRATDHIRRGSYQSPYEHILVDEFQDISKTRADLLLALRRQRETSIVFAVGDDWQSIYRFTGSDIQYTRDFKNFFGATATTALEKTFRFNNQISAVASRFVLQNPTQIVKKLESAKTSDQPEVSLVRVLLVNDGLLMALAAIQATALDGCATVLVLGRYNFTVEEYRTHEKYRELKNRFPSLRIDLMTVHSAKGMEADFVVVLGLGRGKYGFPSEKVNEPVLELLLPDQESFQFAEERRLFYVAMTRARRRVYLPYNPLEPSQFIIELLSENPEYEVCRDEFDDHHHCITIPHAPCPRCSTGMLLVKSGEFRAFVGCNNFPWCKHRERPCPVCGSVMRREGTSRKCCSDACRAQIPNCPKCGSEMVERNGPYGRFWGCSNYRRTGEFVCTATSNITRR